MPEVALLGAGLGEQLTADGVDGLAVLLVAEDVVEDEQVFALIHIVEVVLLRVVGLDGAVFLLIKLVNRETDSSSYELVKAFMGPFKAGFYQTFGLVAQVGGRQMLDSLFILTRSFILKESLFHRKSFMRDLRMMRLFLLHSRGRQMYADFGIHYWKSMMK